ncbi:MAG: exodeoxyribonuclease VII large subunit [Oceanicoccus sp.]|jgi:exodeoxyribonuclease VII large subunit
MKPRKTFQWHKRDVCTTTVDYNVEMLKPPQQKRNPLSISQLNRQAKKLLEGNFPSVWVEGEISNFSQPSSGHWYFSLKDRNAQVRCAMFRNSNNRLRFKVEAGQLVMARAKLSLYEARGDYQLIVEHMEPAGDGALARAFEELKAKLQLEGLFDEALKQEPPSLPRHIAVVTSPTGAAIHDILTVLSRRFPQTKITIFPTPVQGQGAGSEIAKAINRANSMADTLEIDVILAGRGGGSTEDLWAFNEEVVARAIYHSLLPVVSAVGHEVDFTIADFVADVRAATPSAAAELLSPDQAELQSTLSGFEQLLHKAVRQKIATAKHVFQALQKQLRHPGNRLQAHSQRLDELEQRLRNGYSNRQRNQKHRVEILSSRLQQLTPKHKIEQLQQHSSNIYRRLEQQMLQQLQRNDQRLVSTMQLLNTVSPLATLDRGYAIVTNNKEQIVSEIEGVKKGQTVTTRLTNGIFESLVTNIPAKSL